MAVSVLRCEPYLADNGDCDDSGYLRTLPFTLWRVFVDDECIATEALPFSSNDDVVEFAANKCVPFLGDGSQFVCVRQNDNQMLWFGFHERFISTWDDNLPVNQIYRFDAQQYNAAIRQAQALDQALLPASARVETVAVPPPSLRRFLPWASKPKTTLSKPECNKEVPPLELNELRAAIMQVFPQDLDFPLYRLPENSADPRGRYLFRRVWEAINHNQLQLCDPPTAAVEVHIGLDWPDFAECVWQVGRVGDEVALFFEAEPRFPLWVSGFASALRQETFLDVEV